MSRLTCLGDSFRAFAGVVEKCVAGCAGSRSETLAGARCSARVRGPHLAGGMRPPPAAEARTSRDGMRPLPGARVLS